MFQAHTYSRLAMSVAALGLAAGCDQQSSAPAAHASAVASAGARGGSNAGVQNSSSATPATDVNTALRAASEPFEKLTERAFTAPMTTLDLTINEANTAARGVRGSLPADALARLDTELSAVSAARRAQDRAGLALSSIEAYRTIVSAVSADAKVPTEVSLLDYAGFRYDADLKSHPARWGDMAQAVTFARRTAAALSPKGPPPSLSAAVDKAVAAMDLAVKQKNQALAAASVKSELDLVDQLEKAFTAR